MTLEDEFVAARLEPPAGEWRSEEGLRDSAVLAIVLRRGGEDHLLFNRRRDDLPYHPGQICFPGGTRDGAEDAVACALRETREEMGISLDQLTLLGRLPDRVSIAGFRVAAFVARFRGSPEYRPHAAEVAEVFDIPCAALREASRWSLRETTHPMARFKRVPCFDYEGRAVWGLTGIILRDLVAALSDFTPPF